MGGGEEEEKQLEVKILWRRKPGRDKYKKQ
jgi:hypothetical protein